MVKKVKIEGLDCPNCAKALENQINKLPSIKSAKIDFLKATILIDSDNIDNAIKDIITITKQVEPDAKIIYEDNKKRTSGKFIIDLVLLLIGLGVGLCTLLIQMSPPLFWSLFIISALVLGYKTYYKALTLLLKGVVNENLLVTISILGATLVGEHMEGLMVIALYSIGKLLEGLAVEKSRKSIQQLTDLQVEYAVIVKDGKEEKVEPEKVKIGDIIIVKPGEKVPLDGKIIEGNTSLNLQSLTGESLPVNAKTNDKILSGSIVLDGVIKIEVTDLYKDSTVSRIMNLIENASEKKSKAETVISKFSKWYTLGVMILAVIVGTIVSLVTNNINEGIYRGLIFLVVSCPCAFAISVPLSYFSGIGNAAKNGILIKGSNYLDAISHLKLIAFDKTGTITTGEFEVSKIEVIDTNYSEEDILKLSCIGEKYSIHPLAVSICNAYNQEIPNANNVKEVAGEGVYYTYTGDEYFVGKQNKELNGTFVELYKNQIKIGQIQLSDKIKHTSKQTCEHLKQYGIQTAIISGDSENVVKEVASKVNADYTFYELLPEDKYNKIENYKNQNIKIGYVGDGINDAPSLMLADVGFSMGIKGSPASIEASNVVIVDDNPIKVVNAIKISKYTTKIVWQNILFSAIIKFTFLLLGALGITGMLYAVIADVGVTVLAILNSLRALKYQPDKKDDVHNHNEHCCCH